MKTQQFWEIGRLNKREFFSVFELTIALINGPRKCIYQAIQGQNVQCFTADR